MEPTHYERLGVRDDASPEAIRAAYLRLARTVHPDVAGASRDHGRQMASVNEAWRVLSDPGRRALYDRSLVAVAEVGPGSLDRDGRDDLDTADEDLDDDRDFAAAPPWTFRLPVWTMLVLGSLAAIFLVTAYAGSAVRPAPRARTTDGLLQPGDCARVVSGLAQEAQCDGANDGVVIAAIDYDRRCPPGSQGYRRQDLRSGYVCLVTRSSG